MRGALSPWGLARALQQPATQAAISTQRRCSRLARVQHDSSRRATAVEGAKLARVKSEDVFDWPVVVHQMVRVHGARSSRGAAGESDLGSPHLTANPALGAEAQLCVVLVSRHCVSIMPMNLRVFVNDEDIFFFPWGKVRMWNNTFSTS